MTVAYQADDALDVRALDARLRHAEPEKVLEEAVALFGDRLALVSSFGAESAVLLHIAAQVNPDIPVLFLETGMLFGQTLDYRKTLAVKLGLTDVRDLRPLYQDLAVHDPSQDLWKTDTDGCCRIRKVLPLDRALQDFDAWITGRKRFHGGSRLSLPVVEQADGRVKFKPAGQLGQGAAGRLHGAPRPAGPSAGGVRLSVGRLLALHQAGRGGRQCARRPLGGFRKDRMRHTYAAPRHARLRSRRRHLIRRRGPLAACHVHRVRLRSLHDRRFHRRRSAQGQRLPDRAGDLGPALDRRAVQLPHHPRPRASASRTGSS